jgi:ABC-type branched-subunit amino acid transport system ATPase component
VAFTRGLPWSPTGRLWETQLARVEALFPMLRLRGHQVAALLFDGEQQMLAVGRAQMSSPRRLSLELRTSGMNDACSSP